MIEQHFAEWERVDNERRSLRIAQQECATVYRRFFELDPPPSSFISALGLLSTDEARLVLFFLVNLWRFTLFTSPMRTCPFCRSALSSSHFLYCSFLGLPFDFEELVRRALSACDNYMPIFVDIVFVLKRWASLSSRVRPNHARTIQNFQR